MATRLGIGGRFTKVAAIVLVATGAIALGYLLLGHRLIEKAYLGQLPGFLSRLVEGQDRHPLSYFTSRADRVFYREVLPFPILNLVFYYLIYRLFAWLLRQSRGLRAGLLPVRSFRQDWLLALAVYAVCTCLFFAGYIGLLGTSLIGPPEDNQKQYWNMWYVEKALEEGRSLRYTDLILFPEGTSDLMHDYSWYNLALSFALTPAVGRVASYNLLILHSFVLSGLACFLLVKYLVRDSLAAIVGGFVFAFNPSHFAHSLHHVNVSTIQFIPLFALFLIRALRKEGRWNWLLSAGFLSASGLGHPEYVILGLFFIIACYIYLAVVGRRWLIPDAARTSVAVLAAASAALAPFVIDTLRAVARHPWFVRGGHGDFSADLAGLVVPGHWHLLGRLPLIRAANMAYRGNLWESAAYLGIVAIVILLGLRRQLVERWAPYLAGLVAFVLLSLGTYVHFLGNKVQIMLPFSLLKHIPILSQVRTPGRLMVFAYLVLAVLVAAAIRQIIDQKTGARARGAVLCIIFVLLLIDYLPTGREMTPVGMPPCYQVMLEAHPGSAVLDLPGGYENSQRYMMYQTLHGLQIVQGELPRKFEPTLSDSLRWDDLDAERDRLVRNRVRYVVLHKDLVSLGDSVPVEAMRAQYSTIYEDDADLVFELY